MARGLVLIVILSGAALIGAAGCGEKKEPSPEVPAEFTVARKTFDMKCANCHSIGGEKKKGPDLAKVAALPEHNREWIVNYIKDPQSQRPTARMPKFGDKLSAEEIGALADYLATLK